ncbi:MAG: pyridoxamine 5-phosphate oxidase [Chitinophagaceae bacterium]|nr:pyridoxamine 5-phosphate oxidase [Chitinophagaceae bacterium]
MDIAGIRKEYRLQQLRESDVQYDPLLQFKNWFDEAITSKVNEPNAMTLSTVRPSGRPSSRIVLLKGVEQNGFVFYTNYDSDKGHQLEQQPFASLCFFWPELERQVRIEGKVRKVDADVSDAYFKSRPFSSRLGAWVSTQSQIIEGRETLEKKLAEVKALYPADVPRPAHWGGYVLIPDYIEFWQGRESRLHDRIAYTLKDTVNWEIARLAP